MFGRASGSSSLGANFGVQGEAFGAFSGRNYGVFGHVIASENGAAIYGTSHTSCSGETVNGSYAGYFEGNVKVTGSINGIILGNATASSSPTGFQSQQSLDANVITRQLKGLSANSFYLDIHRKNEPIATIDTLTAERGMAALQEQPIVDNGDEFNMTERQVISKQHYALNADQLEEVFPDLVYDNEDGTKSINYVEMVPILVQAINELSAKIETLAGGNGDVMMAKKVATGVDETAESVQTLSLGQNKPNPFSTTTSVEVSVPEDVQSAFIYVYDLTGKKVQQADITARGKQTVQLDAASLEEGMYLYSLIADGKVVQTRRMIVEK